MDCCICSPMALAAFRPPRNSICLTCYEGARCMITFLNKLDENGRDDGNPQPNSVKGISSALKWMEEMKEMEEGLNEKVGFLDAFAVTLRDGIHTDILVKPGTGPPIPAHRALLAARSEIFRTMLGSDDGYKAPPEGTVSLLELDHEELQCFLEFLYRGDLAEEKAEKHAYSLLLAADKYEIPFLKKLCERRILRSLDPSNVLDVLEISEVCSSKTLKESAMSSIVKHVEDVVFSARYDVFALKNAHLCVEITRMLLMGMKDKNIVAYDAGKFQNIR